MRGQVTIQREPDVVTVPDAADGQALASMMILQQQCGTSHAGHWRSDRDGA